MNNRGPLHNGLNFVLFQAGWLVCVVYPGPVAVVSAMLILALHLGVISRSPMGEARFILIGTLLGTLLDGLWFRAGLLVCPEGQPLWIPLWLVALWALFMTTLCHSLAWLGEHRSLMVALPPFAGPFAYWSAAKLGAVTLPEPTISLIAIGLGWLVLFPLLMVVRQHTVREDALV
ncbi:DUF2878 domain-containing protein [Marinobacter halodurans]|uniref:DUF2878 domain-containing protein n=1 Tax=Marinobacter halodurans TaxID=2528979 RepID=A0ABY1ZKW0_9GAMM|nr:DUF2878 domain-containing protein [Marinobacter halodurans]TBW56044.1 DUF2878 domain-containing protein [Marinobacter halodurans]